MPAWNAAHRASLESGFVPLATLDHGVDRLQRAYCQAAGNARPGTAFGKGPRRPGTPTVFPTVTIPGMDQASPSA